MHTKFSLKTLLIATLLPLSSWATSATCTEHFAMGKAPQVTTNVIAAQAREICYSKYGLMHSGITRTPLWSAEHLQAKELQSAKQQKRVNSFHEEESIPASERAVLKDYVHSNFDRGHMSPSGDMPDSQSQHESFSLANMIPQNPDNNQNLWEGIESAVRTKVKQEGDLYVITGPLFLGDTIERINGRVMVPTHIFKAVYSPKKNESAAYLVPNAAGSDYKTIGIAELEQMAGINLFPGLSAKVKSSKLYLPAPTPHGFGNAKSGHSSRGNVEFADGSTATYALKKLSRLIR